jgi:hypothetical protein
MFLTQTQALIMSQNDLAAIPLLARKNLTNSKNW